MPRKGLGDLSGQPLGRRVACHLEPQQLPPAVAQDQKREPSLKAQGRDHKEINGCDRMRVVPENVFQPCDGDPPCTMYFETVDCATSKPSISSSPWIRDAPHFGFSLLIRRACEPIAFEEREVM